MLQSPRTRAGILRGGTAAGNAEGSSTPRGGSPTVSWHRSVTAKADTQRRPPLSNIFPAAKSASPEAPPPPPKPRSNLGSTPLKQAAADGAADAARLTASHDEIATAAAAAPESTRSKDGGSCSEAAEESADVGARSTLSWPRSVAHGEPPRPSLLAAFPAAGQPKSPYSKVQFPSSCSACSVLAQLCVLHDRCKMSTKTRFFLVGIAVRLQRWPCCS